MTDRPTVIKPDMYTLVSKSRQEKHLVLQKHPSEILDALRAVAHGRVLGPLGRIVSWEVRDRKIIANLQEAEFRASSKWGQGGTAVS